MVRFFLILDSNSCIIVCGTNGMVKDHLIPILKDMNYPDENILTF
jgi:hypothetical protein